MSTTEPARRRHCMVVYAPYPLGETRVQREAEVLLKNGYEVDVICLRTPGAAKVDHYNGVRIFREAYRFPLPLVKNGSLAEKFIRYIRFFFSAFFRLSRLHLKNQYQSVQVHNLPDFLVFCTLVPRIGRTPVLLDLHDLMPEFFAGRFKSQQSLLARLIRWQERMACRYADHVITVSEHWKQSLIKRGVPATKCSVVMNVADERIFCPQPEKTPVRPIPGQGSLRLVYHGSIHDRYGLDMVVEAIDILKGEIPDIHLTLIGNGSSVEQLKRTVADRNLEKHVEFCGLVLAEDLPALICSCDLGVVPYRNDIFTDGLLPTKLMEYAALELPAIASRTTAIEAYFKDTLVEFFEPGETHDLVRCIRFLYHNPQRIMELRSGCRKFNDRYNWNKIGAEYVEMVDRLIAQ